MLLRDLAVYASDLAIMPPGWSQGDFNVSAYTPVEAYLDRLPRRKVMLDDLAKVNVVIGPRPARDQPYWAALNVAMIYWPWFDFSRYFTLSRAEQQLRIIEVLHKALLRIARQTESSLTKTRPPSSEARASPAGSRAGSSRSASRSRTPPATTTKRSCRSGWPGWRAAWRSSA